MTLDAAIASLTSSLAHFHVQAAGRTRGELRDAHFLAGVRANLQRPLGDGRRWDAWQSLDRNAAFDLTMSPEVAAAWNTVEQAGAAEVLRLLSGPIDPLVQAALLPRALGNDALAHHCAYLGLPCSRDIAILITLRAVAALSGHPVVAGLRLPSAEVDEAAVVQVAAGLADAICARTVDDPQNAEPVELAWGALRYLYPVVGDAKSPGMDLLLRAFVGRIADRLVEHAEVGVQVFPHAIRSWAFAIVPERAALLGICSELCSPPVAATLDAELAGVLLWFLDQPVHRLPADPHNGWHRLIVDAAAALLVRTIEHGEPAAWWDDRVARTSQRRTGWKMDSSWASNEAARGAWLVWVALGACRRLQEAQSPRLPELRRRTTDVIRSAASLWLWEASSTTAPILIYLPLLAMELALMAPAEDIDSMTNLLLPLVVDSNVAHGMAKLLEPLRPDLADRLTEQATEIQTFQAAMSSDM